MRVLLSSWHGSRVNKNPLDPGSAHHCGGAELQVLYLAEALSREADVAYANLGNPTRQVTGVQAFARPRVGDTASLILEYKGLLREAVSCFRPHILLTYLIHPAGDIASYVLRDHPHRARMSVGTLCGSWEWQVIMRDGGCDLPHASTWLGHALGHNDFFFARSRALCRAIAPRTQACVSRLRPIVASPYARAAVAPVDRLICFARLAPPKRVDLVISAFAACVRDGSIPRTSSLLVIGSGPLDPALRALASEHGRDLGVEFRAGVAHHELSVLLGVARVAVHASAGEGYGTAPLESLAAGVPTVVAGYDAIEEEFASEHLLFSCPLDAIGIADGIRRAWHAERQPSIRIARLHAPARVARIAMRQFRLAWRPL